MTPLPIHLSEASGVPFYRQIVDQVTALVRSGQLAPGAAMPSARELAASLTVSLITIRRAYSDLENAGLVSCRQGQGTFVTLTVAEAAGEKSRADARLLLGESVERASQLGLGAEEILSFVRELLLSKGEPHA